ncbi:MAG: aryl-sulfate sulfotransferase [Anaerolineaceae bacterium]|nr:aryl-sulfate sulfotransferase [Anaerolineaceae bacterium]
MVFISILLDRSDKPTEITLTPSQVITPTPVTEKTINDFGEVLKTTLGKIQAQKEVDASLLQELNSGSYTFTSPLVVVDPYDQAPLTALVLFTTDEPVNISVHIPGEDAISAVDFTFDGYQTDHIIPVYGLYSDQENPVELTATNEAGEIIRTTVSITTGVTPSELINVIRVVDIAKPEQYEPGFNFSFGRNSRLSKIAFDVHGKTRWYTTTSYDNSQLEYDGHFIYSIGEGVNAQVLFLEMNPLGRIYRVFYSPYGNHHDMAQFKENVLITGSNGKTTEDFIYEVNPNTGEIVNSLDLRSVLQRLRNTGFIPVEDPDWFHNNAIVWVEGTDDIIISGRTQSAVIRLSWPDGKIKWILGNHKNWLPMYQKFLLTPEGENFEWQYNQHDPFLLPDQDNDPNTLDLLLFDNGNQRYVNDPEIQRQVAAHEIVEPEVFSRLVHFRIDEKKGTVTQIWEFGKEYGTMLYAPARGSVAQLPNGNILGYFDVQTPSSDITGGGDISNSSNIFEINSDDQIVWEAFEVNKTASGRLTEYRFERRQIYNFSDNYLQLGTPVINLIPKGIYAKYNVTQ